MRGQECVWGLTQSQTPQQPPKEAAASMSLEAPELPVWLGCLRGAWKRLVKVEVFVGPHLLVVARGIFFFFFLTWRHVHPSVAALELLVAACRI